MNLLIKSATIIDPNSSFHQQIADILITDGIITQIGKGIKADAPVFEAEGKQVSPGFFDLNCNIGELGFETKETLETGTRAAAAGGFTGLALMPNTQPPVHSKAEVEYLLNRAKNNLVDVYPLGTISHKRDGKDMAEMYDMYLSGARKGWPERREMLRGRGMTGLALAFPWDLGNICVVVLVRA